MQEENEENLNQIRATFDKVYEYYSNCKTRYGACYKISAVLTFLLREQGFPAIPCIGEYSLIDFPHVTTDHGWVEIYGKVYDIAIIWPLSHEPQNDPSVIFEGKILNSGKPPNAVYGIGLTKECLDEGALLVFDYGFTGYLSNCLEDVVTIRNKLSSTKEIMSPEDFIKSGWENVSDLVQWEFRAGDRNRCTRCHSTRVFPKMCPCHIVVYCSVECQRKDRKRHKSHCTTAKSK